MRKNGNFANEDVGTWGWNVRKKTNRIEYMSKTSLVDQIFDYNYDTTMRNSDEQCITRGEHEHPRAAHTNMYHRVSYGV